MTFRNYWQEAASILNKFVIVTITCAAFLLLLLL